MTIQELLKALVETEDQMQRMTLVEENQELLTPVESTEPTEDWKAKYEELKQKYIDRFFNGEPQEEPKEPEEPKEEPVTYDDAVKMF